MEGTAKAQKVAKETMRKVKEAMKLNYQGHNKNISKIISKMSNYKKWKK